MRWLKPAALLLVPFLVMTGPFPVLRAEEHQASDSDITAFIKAAEGGDLETVRSLIGRVDVNAEHKDHGRALKRAIVKGHPEIVRFLIENGADVNHAGRFKYTPLFALTWAKHDSVVEIAKLLVRAGADVEASADTQVGYLTPLILAAAKPNQLETLALLIEAGADVKAIDKMGRTPIYNARLRRRAEVVDLLVEAGAEE